MSQTDNLFPNSSRDHPHRPYAFPLAGAEGGNSTNGNINPYFPNSPIADHNSQTSNHLLSYGLVNYATTALASPFEVAQTLLQVQYLPRGLEPASTKEEEGNYWNQEGDSDSDSEEYYRATAGEDDTLSQASSRYTRDNQGYLVEGSDAGTLPFYQLPDLRGGIWSAIKEITHHPSEGVLALWKGQFTYWMHDLSQLFLQPTLEAVLNDTFDLYDNTIPLVHLDHVAGNLSTVVASHLIVGYLLNPFDIIRTRLIAQSSSPNHQKYHGPFHGLTTVVQEEGLRSLYAGVHLPVTLIYHTLVPLLRNVTPLVIDRALHLSSSSSPFLYTLAEFGFNTMELLITLPIDTIRKRLYIQLQGQHNRIIPFTTCVRTRQAPYTGMLDCGVKMLTEEGTNDSWLGSIGIGSLYKGFSLHWSSNLVTSLIKLVTGGNDDADW